jgi:O-methyltransferase
MTRQHPAERAPGGVGPPQAVSAAAARIMGVRWRFLSRRRAGATGANADPTPGPDNLDDGFRELRELVAPATMTSTERMHALYQAINYVTDARVEGAVVECGVWRGGSSMLGALTLLARGERSRTLWLYDTFEGMTPPGEFDVRYDGGAAHTLLAAQEPTPDLVNDWCVASMDAVRENMRRTAYPLERIRLVKGRVEDTIPANAPDAIAVLRLDTDWFESTWHELVHLYPRIVPGGVLIVDDYGWWKGARRAVQRYFAEHDVRMLLTRVDNTGRMGIKPTGR